MRTVSLLGVLTIAVLVALAPTAAALAAVGGSSDGTAPDRGSSVPQHADNESNSTTPGQRLAGVVGVQQAEIEGEMEERTFGIRIAKAASDRAKAAVVADQLSSVEQRLEAVEQRKQALEAARENGSISQGEYRAKMAEVAANASVSQRLANVSSETAGSLPTDLLADKGVDASAIQTLRDRAKDLTGPEVAEIARSIAGPGVGQGIGADNRPDHAGPPNGTPGNGAGNAGEGNAGDGAPGTGGPPNGTPGDGAGNADDGAPGDGGAPNGTPGNGAGDAGDGAPGTGGPPNGTPGDGAGNAGNGSAGVGGPPNGTPGDGAGNASDGGTQTGGVGNGSAPGNVSAGNGSAGAGAADNATDGSADDSGTEDDSTDDDSEDESSSLRADAASLP